MKYAIALVVIAILVACHVAPLPVPNRGDWDPGSGATDYPALSARDAGDAAK